MFIFSPQLKLVFWIMLLFSIIVFTLDGPTSMLLLSRIALASVLFHYVFLLLEKR